MQKHFQQTGELVCERCGMPREYAIAAHYDACLVESDFATDGYPEPGELHEWVRVTPPTAPLILPMGVQLAEERAREMAVSMGEDR